MTQLPTFLLALAYSMIIAPIEFYICWLRKIWKELTLHAIQIKTGRILALLTKDLPWNLNNKMGIFFKKTIIFKEFDCTLLIHSKKWVNKFLHIPYWPTIILFLTTIHLLEFWPAHILKTNSGGGWINSHFLEWMWSVLVQFFF